MAKSVYVLCFGQILTPYMKLLRLLVLFITTFMCTCVYFKVKKCAMTSSPSQNLCCSGSDLNDSNCVKIYNFYVSLMHCLCRLFTATYCLYLSVCQFISFTEKRHVSFSYLDGCFKPTYLRVPCFLLCFQTCDISPKVPYCCGITTKCVKNVTCFSSFLFLSPLFLKHCGIGQKKTKLLLDLKPIQNVPKHSLFKLWKFHENIYCWFFLEACTL